MCGVVGSCSPKGIVDPELVKQMLPFIAHRGPDGEGLWCDENSKCCLGHSRLSIIDTTQEGSQPMHSRDRRYVISFNGEIYNYLELKNELSKSGTVFLGRSDTEVLVEGFSAWGIEATLKRVIGMFAGCVWDTKNKNFLMFRDRVGKKPLYYTIQNGTLWVASEIKALQSLAGLSFNIDTNVMSHYLSLGYVPSPCSIFSEIHAVQPGFIYSLKETGEVVESCYWSLPNIQNDHTDKRTLVDEIESLLTASVSLRLRSDVPLGIFLSGGIDSGLLTALASRHSSAPVKTFSATFRGYGVDESVMAKLVSDIYQTEHHEVELDLHVRDVVPKVAGCYDEPFGDPSAVPTFVLAKEAAKTVKVVLNGEGSDELFGGYRRHSAVYAYQKLQFFLHPFVLASLYKAFNEMPKPKIMRSKYHYLFRFLNGFSSNPVERYLSWGDDIFHENEKQNLFRETPLQKTTDFLSKRFFELEEMDATTNFMRMDFLLGMTDCLLKKVDTATMASGLEGRSPFLDHRLVELAFRTKRNDLLSLNETKPTLRMLAKKYLPPVLTEAPKRGFEVPLVEWVNGALRSQIADECLQLNGVIDTFFNKKQIIDLIETKTRQDPQKRAKQLWVLFMLALWGNSLNENSSCHAR